MINETITTDWYFLPMDANKLVDDINQDLLNATNDVQSQVLISSFVFTPSLFPSLLTLAKKGIAIYVLHDKTQWGKDVKKRFKPLIDAGVDVVLASSDVKENLTNPRSRKYNTLHDKTLVVNAANPIIWTGSMNFTYRGTLQENKMVRFSSLYWRDTFANRFGYLWDWCQDNVSQKL